MGRNSELQMADIINCMGFDIVKTWEYLRWHLFGLLWNLPQNCLILFCPNPNQKSSLMKCSHFTVFNSCSKPYIDRHSIDACMLQFWTVSPPCISKTCRPKRRIELKMARFQDGIKFSRITYWQSVPRLHILWHLHILLEWSWLPSNNLNVLHNIFYR